MICYATDIVQLEDLTQLLRKYRFPAGLVVAGLFLFITGLAASLGESKQDEVSFKTQEQLTPIQTNPQTVVIDIGGAVKKPGVYELPSGARIKDAVHKAGGFLNDTDQEQISFKVNLAALLTDGQKVVIPVKNEEIGEEQTVAETTTDKSISINNATQSELESLSGIGPVRAGEIISNRPYGDISEIGRAHV